MKLVCGLGNPEPKYSWTRHNIGKEVLNLYVPDSWKTSKKLGIQYVSNASNECIFIKPLNYMNEAGESISRTLSYFNISLSDFLIIYDELDLPVGSYKFAFGKGSRIHNGIISVESKIGTDKFWHLRIGVREQTIESSVQKTGRDPSKYVLNKFPLSDKKKIKNLIQESILAELNSFLSKKW